MHKGEGTTESIKFLKCGQAGKTKETVKATKMLILFSVQVQEIEIVQCSKVKRLAGNKEIWLQSQICGFPIRKWKNYFNYWAYQ